LASDLCQHHEGAFVAHQERRFAKPEGLKNGDLEIAAPWAKQSGRDFRPARKVVSTIGEP
jgi:hypothetical protein